MSKQTVSISLDADKKAALDAIAAHEERDVDAILNDAIAVYLDTYAWQIEHIRQGIEAADRGEFATDSEVAAAFAKWRHADTLD